MIVRQGQFAAIGHSYAAMYFTSRTRIREPFSWLQHKALRFPCCKTRQPRPHHRSRHHVTEPRPTYGHRDHRTSKFCALPARHHIHHRNVLVGQCLPQTNQQTGLLCCMGQRRDQRCHIDWRLRSTLRRKITSMSIPSIHYSNVSASFVAVQSRD